ncbi:MAG: pyrimidine dimer DNA glycosylase/endonuclease V [Nitrospirota bacterium]
MRLWTLHPKYLDPKGLTALWREALLAQKVLAGGCQGYRNHPQLIRFRQQSEPLAAIADYLRAVYEESVRRGYRFDNEKIISKKQGRAITVTNEQLLYEWNHLKKKLKIRDYARYQTLRCIKKPEAHPLFAVIKGAIEAWEIRPD